MTVRAAQALEAFIEREKSGDYSQWAYDPRNDVVAVLAELVTLKDALVAVRDLLGCGPGKEYVVSSDPNQDNSDAALEIIREALGRQGQ